MSFYFFILNILWYLVNSSAVKEPVNRIKVMSTENNNRIKSKHLEMWDIILSILDRKEVLENFVKTHNSSEKVLGYDSKLFSMYGEYSYEDTVKQLDKKQLNNMQQFYKFNVEMSTLLLKELKRLSQLERECQGLI